MNGHDEYLELLAASIDFGLTEEEVARLNYHLASCPECRRAATELRGQNAVIGTTPIVPLAPARSEQILRAALRKPATRPRWGMLAVAALLATLAGGVAFAGLRMVDTDPAPSEPPPSQVAEASLPPSATPVEESVAPGAQPTAEGPRITPNPGDEGPPPDAAELAFPLPYTHRQGTIGVAPANDNQLWVSVGGDHETVVALLDADGRQLPNWPIVEPFAENCRPLAASDGSIRLICYYSNLEACVDSCVEQRVFAFRAPGTELAGFPVTLPNGNSADVVGTRVVGTDVVTVVIESSDEVVAEFGEFGSAHVTTVGAEGAIKDGVNVQAPVRCCTIGPDGVAYGSSSLEEQESETRTQLIAFDGNGMRPGWPIVVDGTASAPSFGPNNQLAYSSWIDEASRIVRLNPDGSPAGDPVDVGVTVDWSPDVDGPIPPLVDENGRVWLVAQGLIYGFDANGDALGGLPYEPETGLLERGNDCGPNDTGCQSWLEPPRMAPRGLVYTLESAPSGMGARITVVNPDGSVRSGWPKTLQRAGADWESVTIGENRRAYAVAVEPEPNSKSSISVLAFAPNGTREWITTLVEP